MPLAAQSRSTQPSTENVMKTILAAFASVAILAGAFAPSAAQTPPASSQRAGSVVDFKHLAQALRTGGYVILVRHGATFSNQADTDPFTFTDVAKQRNLNDKGKELARAFGEAIRAAGIPVGKVYTSKFNRAYETAVLAGFRTIETTVDLTEGGLVVTPDENTRRAEALRTMLAKAPAPEKNDLLITHKPNIIDALGKDWFDVKEGEATIFKPDAGKFQLLARVQMADWSKIATPER
jgi:phosphohistidine phosphatase SixA